jgi:prenyltransferase beta subunit
MNPHVHPSPPSRSFWQKLGGSSLSVSLLIHLLLVFGGVVWVIRVIPNEEKNVDFTTRSGGGSPAPELRENKQRAPMSRPSLTRTTALGAATDFTLPDPGEAAQMTSLGGLGGGSLSNGGGPGSGGDFGKGVSMVPGTGSGPLFRMIPEDMRKRCSKNDRLARLQENGGTPACEEAVEKSLRWLKASQNSDGSWGKRHLPAMTGLVLLSYFGHCETPASEEFGESCMRGIIHLVNLGMKNNGRMSDQFTGNDWCYQHAIATYALGEAATFCKELKLSVPQLMEVTAKAGQYIIDNQNPNGGWAYLYNTAGTGGHTDTSITGWQLQALKACSHTGIQFKGMKTCVDRGLDYLKSCQNETGGFGYSNKSNAGHGGAYFGLTGVGMLSLQMWGKENNREVRRAAKYITENSRFDYNGKDSNLYAHYYESQAMMRSGGKDWQHYNELFRDQLLHNQDADGSWKSPGDKHAAGEGNRIYRTALCTLMLEVYYRFLSSSGGRAGGRPGI